MFCSQRCHVPGADSVSQPVGAVDDFYGSLGSKTWTELQRRKRWGYKFLFLDSALRGITFC